MISTKFKYKDICAIKHYMIIHTFAFLYIINTRLRYCISFFNNNILLSHLIKNQQGKQ